MKFKPGKLYNMNMCICGRAIKKSKGIVITEFRNGIGQVSFSPRLG